MKISVTAWGKYKPQGTAGIRYPPKADYTTGGGPLWAWRKEGYGTALSVEPALQDERGGKLVDDASAYSSAAHLAAGVVASGFQRGLGFGGGESLIPEVDGEADSVCIGDIFAIFAGLD
jgi:hypothetical protein